MDFGAVLAANGLSIAIVGFLLKLWVDKRLSYSLNKELEKFKAELSKDISLSTLKNTWNHNKKVELLCQLNEYMLDADFELKAFLVNIKLKKKDLIYSRANKFMEKYLELNSCIHKNELFLERSLIDEVRDTYNPFFDLALMAVDEVSDSVIQELEKNLPNGMNEIFYIGGKPRSSLVKRFKAEIGIV